MQHQCSSSYTAFGYRLFCVLCTAIVSLPPVLSQMPKHMGQNATANPETHVAKVVSEVQTIEGYSGLTHVDGDPYVREYLNEGDVVTSNVVVRDVLKRKSKQIVSGGMSPAWSPDGSRVAFLSFKQYNPYSISQIEVTNADGSGKRRLTNAFLPFGIDQFAWSPSGTDIAYFEFPKLDSHFKFPRLDGHGRIVKVNADNAQRSELTSLMDLQCVMHTELAWSPGGKSIAYLAWSPDGNSIAFNGCGSNGKPVVAILRNGIITDVTEAYGALWSPDGTRFVFRRDTGGTNPVVSIWVCNADGSAPRLVLQNESAEYGLAWFPDGKSIAFGSQRESKWSEIFRINADGTGLEKIASHQKHMLSSPLISPQGDVVAFNEGWGNGGFSIWIMSLTGQGERNLMRGGNLGGILWQK
jgi:TolB protein